MNALIHEYGTPRDSSCRMKRWATADLYVSIIVRKAWDTFTPSPAWKQITPTTKEYMHQIGKCRVGPKASADRRSLRLHSLCYVWISANITTVPIQYFSQAPIATPGSLQAIFVCLCSRTSRASGRDKVQWMLRRLSGVVIQLSQSYAWKHQCSRVAHASSVHMQCADLSPERRARAAELARCARRTGRTKRPQLLGPLVRVPPDASAIAIFMNVEIPASVGQVSFGFAEN